MGRWGEEGKEARKEVGRGSGEQGGGRYEVEKLKGRRKG